MKLKIGVENKLLADTIGKEMVADMTKAHRKWWRLNLKYSHFNLYEILDFCIDNDVLPTDICDLIKRPENQIKIKQHGIKIYLGKHFKGTYPEGKEDYLNETTTILCNTNIIDEDQFIYEDILGIDKKLLIPIPSKKEGEEPYLDQTNICPPDNPEGEDESDGRRILRRNNPKYDIGLYEPQSKK